MKHQSPGSRKYHRGINAWCLYDWANSAFATTVMAALFGPFFRTLVLASGRGPREATAFWGYTTAVSLALIALASPILGAAADASGNRKRFLAAFAGLGAGATFCFIFIGKDTWLAASILFILANAGFAGANVFYDALLPHVASAEDADRVSTRGYALGYVGGGVLLIINLLWISYPGWFGMPGAGFAVRASFASVAAWWILFSIPLFRYVSEPAPDHATGGLRALSESFSRLGATFAQIRRYRQLLLFLCAFWIYSDGIGTIIKMATAFGHEIGIGIGHMTLALVITQFVGIPATLAFGSLAKKTGAQKSILIGLAAYAGICVGGTFMRTPAHFYILAALVGLVQGGTQGLSRSLFAAMVPQNKSAEFFGFFSVSDKMAGIAGPLLFGLVSQLAQNSRIAILSLALFFLAGAWLLSRVNVEEGQRAALHG